MNTIRAAVYCRVSTKLQAGEDKVSIPDQLRECKAYIEKQGWAFAGSYVDPGISANTIERPALNRLLSSMDTWDLVVAWDFDRFYRDKRSVAGYILDVLDENRKQITSTKQPIPVYDPETFDPKQNDTPYMLREMAGFTSGIDNRRRFRTLHKGLREKVAQGYMIKPPPYGYRVKHEILDGRVVRALREVVKEEAEIVERIFTEYCQGKSYFALASLLNREAIPTQKQKTWSANVVRGIIMNPVYCGKVRTNAVVKRSGRKRTNPESEWKLFPGKHQAIITESVWQQAQTVRRRKQKKSRAIGAPWLLSGLLKCGHCGWAMVKVGGWGGGYYNCGNYHQTHNCQVNSYRRIHLEAHVLRYLFRLLRDDRLYDKVKERDNCCLLDQMKADNDRLRSQLEDLPKRKNLLFDLYETSQITKSEFVERRAGHARKEEELGTVLRENEARLKKLEAAVVNPEKFRAALKDLEATFERSDIVVKKGKLQALIDTIVIKNKSFNVNFHLSPAAD
jgi:site-specific DNA recombinase